jgi:hypothetical protein
VRTVTGWDYGGVSYLVHLETDNGEPAQLVIDAVGNGIERTATLPYLSPLDAFMWTVGTDRERANRAETHLPN